MASTDIQKQFFQVITLPMKENIPQSKINEKYNVPKKKNNNNNNKIEVYVG